MSNSNTNPTFTNVWKHCFGVARLNEATEDAIYEVLEDCKNGDGTMDSLNATLDFLEKVQADPANIMNAKLEYFAAIGDNSKGREIVDKLGPDATFGDLDKAIKDGTISTQE